MDIGVEKCEDVVENFPISVETINVETQEAPQTPRRALGSTGCSHFQVNHSYTPDSQRKGGNLERFGGKKHTQQKPCVLINL